MRSLHPGGDRICGGHPRGAPRYFETGLATLWLCIQLTGDDKTVLRGGIGAYQASTLGTVYYSLTGTLQAYTNEYYNVETGGVGPAFTWPATSFGTTGLAPYGSAHFGTANSVAWKEPYSLQWNLSGARPRAGTGCV